jgi:hypothetical protein
LVNKQKNKNSKKSHSNSSDSHSNPSKTKKPREKQKGAKGNGRTTADHLPTFTETFDFLSEKEKTCSCCGKQFADFFITENSKEMVLDIKAHRRIIKKISTNVQVSP